MLDLFQRFDRAFKNQDARAGGKDDLWQAVLASNDVVVGDDVANSASEGLGIEELVMQGLAEKIIVRLRPQERESQHANHLAQAGSEAVDPVTSTIQVQNGHDVSSKAQDGNNAPVKPRRGRPPKAKAAAVVSLTNTTQPPNPNVPTTGLEKGENALLKPRRGRKPKAKASTTQVEAVATTPETTAHPPTPRMPSSLSATGVRSSQRQPKARVRFEDEMSTPSKPEPAPKRKNKDQAVYTSYEDMMREQDEAQRAAGVARVYINPPGSEKPKSEKKKWERSSNHIIAVFKSDKLKDPTWLEEHKGSGVEFVAQRRLAQDAQAQEARAAESQARLANKRKQAVEEGEKTATPRKRRKSTPKVTPAPNGNLSLGAIESMTMQNPAIPVYQYPVAYSQIPTQAPLTISAQSTGPNQQTYSSVHPILQHPFPPAATAIFGPRQNVGTSHIQVPVHARPSTPTVAPVQFRTYSTYSSPYGPPSSPPKESSTPVAPQAPPISQNSRPDTSLLPDQSPQNYHSVHEPVPSSTQTSQALDGLNVSPAIANGSSGPVSTAVQAPQKTPPVPAEQQQESPIVHSHPNPTVVTPQQNVFTYVSPYASSQKGQQDMSHTPAQAAQVMSPAPPQYQGVPGMVPQQVYNQPMPVYPQFGTVQGPPQAMIPAGQGWPLYYGQVPVMIDPMTGNPKSVLPAPAAPKKRRARKRKAPNDQPDEVAAGPSKKVKQHEVNTNGVDPSRLSQPPADSSSTPLPDPYADATSVPLPDVECRMSVAYNDTYGNLYLSKDQTSVHFQAVSDEQPSLNIDIMSITENPNTSMPKSKPMEIRIKVRGEARTPNIHQFKFASTDEAYNAANKFRADVVTAMIKATMKANNESFSEEVSEEVTKPFKCDTCGSRYKNKLGLDYHLSKSQTTCNPNFVPGTETVRKAPARERRADSVTTPSKSAGKSKELNAFDKPMDSVEGDGDSEDTSSNSEADSVIEWAENLATKVNEKSSTRTRQGRPLPRNRASQSVEASGPDSQQASFDSVPVEKAVLQDIVQTVEAPPDDELAVQQNKVDTSSVAVNDIADPVLQQSQNVICELVEANGGVFPGERGLWYAFVAAWLKRHAQSRVLPEYQLCLDTVASLVGTGELQKIEHAFKDEQGLECSRVIITKPGLNVASQSVLDLKKAIEKEYPQYHVPNRFAPPPAIMSRLQPLGKGFNMDAAGQQEVRQRRVRLPTELLVGDQSSEEEFIPDEAAAVEDDPMDDDAESDDEFKPRSVAKRNRNVNLLSLGHLLGNDVRPFMEREKRGSFLERKKRMQGRASPLKGTKLPEEVLAKRKNTQIINQQTWKKPITFLQDHKTGAWSSPPYRVKKPRTPRKTYHLPEPVTFMQDHNSAWSFRPYGHGVRPIYTRPARSDQNRLSSWNYRKTIESGFRPLLAPNKDDRHGPSQPAKRFTEPSRDFSETPSILSGSEQPSDADRGSQRPEAAKPKLNVFGRGPGRPRKLGNDSGSRAKRAHVLKNARSRKASQQFPTADNIDHDAVSSWINASWQGNDLIQSGPRNLAQSQIDPSLESLPAGYLGDSFVRVNVPIFPATNRLGINAMDIDPAASDRDQAVEVPGNHVSAYSKLMDEDLGDSISALTQDPNAVKRRRRRPAYTNRKPDLGADFEKLTCNRRLTALDTDLDGCLDDSCFRQHNDEVLQLKYIVRPLHSGTRQRHTEGELSRELEARLIAAAVAIRTLTGGVEKMIDWVLVGTLFPQYSLSYLQRNWMRISKKTERAIENLGTDFQQAFLIGYRDGQVDPIDYDNLIEYDWSKLVDWVLETIPIESGSQYTDLPESKAELEKTYDFNTQPDTGSLAESYYNLLTPMYKRMENASAQPRATPIKSPESKPIDFFTDDLALTRSWVKAVTLTPEHQFDPADAGSKLEKMPPKLVEAAISSLISDKIIVRKKGKSTLRRPYEPTDAFLAPLRKHINEKIYLEAAQYKTWLDEQFLNGLPCVPFDYMSDEGTTMVVTNLQAHGRIKLKARNIPMDEWGLTEKYADGTRSYETRKMDKSVFNFPLDIYRTSTYLPDSENPILHHALNVEPPRGGPRGELPIWYGIGDELNHDLWKKVLASVAGVVAMRTPVEVQALVKCYPPALEEWEVRRLVEWGREVGVWRKIVDHADRWMVGEWWWLVVGRVCAEDLEGDGEEGEGEEEGER